MQSSQTSVSKTYIPKTTEEKIKIATQRKLQGNEYFKAKEYKKAIREYKSVFLYINGLSSNLQEVFTQNQSGSLPTQSKLTPQEEEIKQLRLTTRLNLSTCYAKLGNATKALENAQKALAIDNTNTKALFRRGQAYLALGDIDRAQEDLQKVKEKLPNDSAVKAEMEKLRKKIQEHQKKEKKIFTKMFEKMSTST